MPHEEWEDLASRHSGHRHLSRPQLLTLPVPVVEAKLPSFFRPKDVAFEKDLAPPSWSFSIDR
jgi:hypothetical protein